MMDPITISAVLSATVLGILAKNIAGWLVKSSDKNPKITIKTEDGQSLEIPLSSLTSAKNVAEVIKQLRTNNVTRSN
jgi:hypothetical protein